MKTKKEFIEYLNEIGECLPSENFIMAGKMRRGKYGELLKRHDPIAFEAGFSGYKQSGW